jgi:hypothetical protein
MSEGMFVGRSTRANDRQLDISSKSDCLGDPGHGYVQALPWRDTADDQSPKRVSILTPTVPLGVASIYAIDPAVENSKLVRRDALTKC